MTIVPKGWMVVGYRATGKKALQLSQTFTVREAATRFAMLAHAQYPDLRIEVEEKLCVDDLPPNLESRWQT